MGFEKIDDKDDQNTCRHGDGDNTNWFLIPVIECSFGIDRDPDVYAGSRSGAAFIR